MRGREGEGREDIWGGRGGRRGRGFGGFDGVLVSLISFDSSGIVLGNQILVVEPAVMHMVPPFLSVFLGGSLAVSRFSNLEFFWALGESCCPTTNRYRFLLIVLSRVTLQREMLND